MKKLIFISFLLVCVQTLYAQTYFTKFYGRPGERSFYANATPNCIEIALKKYQCLYNVGNISTNMSYFNIATLNEYGDTILSKKYIKQGTSYWMSGIVAKKEFLYYSGQVFDSLTQREYFMLIKVNLLGDTTWTKRYNLPYNTGICRSLLETSDKGFVLVGLTTPYDTVTNQYGLSKAQVIKVDSAGNLKWSKNYGSANTSDIIESAIETPEKDLIYVGVKDIYSFSGVDYQYYLFKTDSLGNLRWEKSYGSPSWLEVYTNIIRTKDNNYLLGGGANYTPNTNRNAPVQLTKINSNGDTLWRKELLRDAADNISDMYETDNGNIVFTGWTYGFTNHRQAAGFLYKVTAQGDSLWMRIIDSDTLHDDYINRLSPTSDKGFILTGAGLPLGKLNGEAWIIKVDSLGCTYNGCAINTATHDYTEGSLLMTLFPNPASDVLTIGFKTTALVKNAQLKVTDILGRQVKNIPFETLPTEYEIDVGSLPNGTYFCTFMSDGKVWETKKFSIVR
jgi:hypothetical protein